MSLKLCICGHPNFRHRMFAGEPVCFGCGGGKPHQFEPQLPTCALCDEPITDTPVPVHEYGDAVGHEACVANAGEAADVAKHGGAA